MYPPLISVIIPTFNRGDTLCAAVQSVLDQNFSRYEVIVVDDCSKKAAQVSLDEGGIKDPRVKVIRLELNRGQAAARNAGAKAARGKWLALLDDDDVFYPRKLSAQLNYMIANKLKVSVTDFTLPADRHVFGFRNSDWNSDWLILSGRFLALPSTMMIDKKFYREIGGFDEDPSVRRTEDLDFALRLYKQKTNLRVMPAFLSHYSGFHPSNPAFELKALEGIERKHRQTFEPDTEAAQLLNVSLAWKKTHAEMTNKSILVRAVRFGRLALRNPIHVATLAASIAENPFHRLFPPEDRPRMNASCDPSLVKPYVPV